MKYRQSFEVRFCEADRRSLLTPVALFNFIQEAAIRHGDAANIEGEALRILGYVWMMNRIHMRIDRYPLRRETVHVETWGSSLHGLFAVREWRVCDDAGTEIASATARWFMIDVEKRKIVKLPVVIAEHYGEHEERGIEDSFDRMTPIESGDHEKRFHVRLSELDTNQHANSVAYVDWCLEAVPEDVLNDYLPRDIEIVYKKESKLGDGLIAKSAEDSPVTDGDRVFNHAIRLEDDGTLLTMGRSVWRKVE